MSIAFACPQCGRKFNVDDRFAGRKTPCAGCGVELTVPEVASEPAKAKPAAVAKKSSGPLMPSLSRAKHEEDLIDMTAMVDIVFFLLIFFLVTSLQSLESVMNLPTPETQDSAQAKPRSVVDYENDSNFVVIRIEADDSMWIDDEQVFSEQELRSRLRDSRRKTAGLRNALIVGDADASHAAAVTVFDACAEAGLENVSFTVQEKSD